MWMCLGTHLRICFADSSVFIRATEERKRKKIGGLKISHELSTTQLNGRKTVDQGFSSFLATKNVFSVWIKICLSTVEAEEPTKLRGKTDDQICRISSRVAAVQPRESSHRHMSIRPESAVLGFLGSILFSFDQFIVDQYLFSTLVERRHDVETSFLAVVDIGNLFIDLNFSSFLSLPLHLCHSIARSDVYHLTEWISNLESEASCFFSLPLFSVKCIDWEQDLCIDIFTISQRMCFNILSSRLDCRQRQRGSKGE